MGIAAVVLGIIGLVVGVAIGRFILAAPMQRKLESIERAKARQGKAYEEIESENKQFQTQLLDTEKRMQELEAAYQTQLQERDRAYQTQIQALQEGRSLVDTGISSDSGDLIQTYQNQIQDLQASHQSAIQSLEQSFQQQIHDLQTAHQTALEEQQQSYQAQIQDLQQSHQTEIHNLEATYKEQIQSLLQQGKDATASATETVIGGVSSVVTGVAGVMAGIAAGTGLADLLQRNEETSGIDPETPMEEVAEELVIVEESFELGAGAELPAEEMSGFSEGTTLTDVMDDAEIPVLDSMPMEGLVIEEVSSREFAESDREPISELSKLDDAFVDNLDTQELENRLDEFPRFGDYPEQNDAESIDILNRKVPDRLDESPSSPDLLVEEKDPFSLFDEETEASDLEFLSMLQTEDLSLIAELPDSDDPFSLELDKSDELLEGENSQNGHQSGFDMLMDDLAFKDEPSLHGN